MVSLCLKQVLLIGAMDSLSEGLSMKSENNFNVENK